MTPVGKNKKQQNNSTKKKKTTNSTILGSLQGNNLEFIVAALLITGKLRVDAVQLFREATMIVSLVGQYNTLKKMNNTNVNDLINFINNNANLTLNELIQAMGVNTEA